MEKEQIKRGCCELPSGVWMSTGGLPVLPKSIFPFLAKLTHDPDHVLKGVMIDMVNRLLYVPRFSAFADNFCKECLFCAMSNIGRGQTMTLSAHLKPEGPFEH